jgi:hypothetical protein
MLKMTVMNSVHRHAMMHTGRPHLPRLNRPGLKDRSEVISLHVLQDKA